MDEMKDMLDDTVDRCCCECGNHFEGYPEDDYCSACWDSLGLGELPDFLVRKAEVNVRCEDTIDMFLQTEGMGETKDVT